MKRARERRPKDQLAQYRKFSSQTWGALVNIALILNPANLALKLGLGTGFIPLYGNSVLATGLATFLSIFVVFAIFAGRQGILEEAQRPTEAGYKSEYRGEELVVERKRSKVWFSFLVALVSGIGLLAAYVAIEPTNDLGAFLYAGSFMSFTGAFHILAVKEFMMSQAGPPPPQRVASDALEWGRSSIAKSLQVPVDDLLFSLISQDEQEWKYWVRRQDPHSLPYRATIRKTDGEVTELVRDRS